jgi:hypothetical protein
MLKLHSSRVGIKYILYYTTMDDMQSARPNPNPIMREQVSFFWLAPSVDGDRSFSAKKRWPRSIRSRHAMHAYILYVCWCTCRRCPINQRPYPSSPRQLRRQAHAHTHAQLRPRCAVAPSDDRHTLHCWLGASTHCCTAFVHRPAGSRVPRWRRRAFG